MQRDPLHWDFYFFKNFAKGTYHIADVVTNGFLTDKQLTCDVFGGFILNQ